MKKTILITALCAASMSLIYTSCKKKSDPVVEEPTPTPTPAPSLYERVGGTAVVSDPTKSGSTIEKGRLTLRSVVDSAIYVIAGDATMTPYFGKLLGEVTAGNTTGFAALSKNFTDFLCSATGSKNSAYAYVGLSMKDAHDPAKHSRMGTKADAASFDKFVGDIGTALAKNGVTSTNNKALVDDLVALLYTVKGDVVQK
jgi:hypothetical protein